MYHVGLLGNSCMKYLLQEYHIAYRTQSISASWQQGNHPIYTALRAAQEQCQSAARSLHMDGIIGWTDDPQATLCYGPPEVPSRSWWSFNSTSSEGRETFSADVQPSLSLSLFLLLFSFALPHSYSHSLPSRVDVLGFLIRNQDWDLSDISPTYHHQWLSSGRTFGLRSPAFHFPISFPNSLRQTDPSIDPSILFCYYSSSSLIPVSFFLLARPFLVLFCFCVILFGYVLQHGSS
ncbi:hypothetical protein F4775DRAFT_87749 [Biscogniauxia sp. FL1348]|nr:hypothetical protein F4775DRAFT_87749 [Biscogniauxia sp. FL1348]